MYVYMYLFEFVYLQLCVCIYIYMYVCVTAYMYICKYLCITYIYIYICMRLSIHVNMFINMFSYLSTPKIAKTSLYFSPLAVGERPRTSADTNPLQPMLNTFVWWQFCRTWFF